KIEDFRAKYSGRGGQVDIRSDARRNYEWYYSEEEEINVKLNIFAVNMEKAYGGKNDLRNQLGIDSNAGEMNIKHCQYRDHEKRL
ncbi:inositol 1,4,5-trisphosphate receptor type 3, partial [Elysia marginata]